MSEMDGPGAYGRKRYGRTAEEAYNTLRCAPALIWIAEALGEDAAVVRSAVSAADSAGSNHSSQCGAIQKLVPWTRVEELVAGQPSRASSRAGRIARSLGKRRGSKGETPILPRLSRRVISGNP